MDKEALKKRFYELVSPSMPNEWEVDGIIEEISETPLPIRESLFSQIPVIWPVSNSLCLSFLEDGCSVIGTIPAELIPKWVRAILRRYEQRGLAGARELIVNADQLFLMPLKKRNNVRFEDVRKRMLFYLRGISGEDLDIGIAPVPYTNTTTFYVPKAISLLDSYRKNQLLYKFLLTLHWGFIHLGTFKIRSPVEGSGEFLVKPGSDDESGTNPLGDYFARFDNPQLAADIFFLLETKRVMSWMKKDLPGLVNEFSKLEEDLARSIAASFESHPGNEFTTVAFNILFDKKFSPGLEKAWGSERERQAQSWQTMAAVEELYDRLTPGGESYQRPPLLVLLGRHDFTKASAEIDRKRSAMKEMFILHLQALKDKSESSAPQSSGSDPSQEADQAIALISDAATDSPQIQLQQILDNPEIDLPEELLNLIERIKQDLGHVPPSWFSAASGVSGDGFARQDAVSSHRPEEPDAQGGILLDEWDYRRNGYRKNWCQIIERDITLLQSTFVDATLEKHRGLLLKLRRQFELMKTNEHFVRRQREGDDIDLDAIVEARGDLRAGLSPSSKLFVRLQRNDRDIATIFLVDMSNSTEGWVGTVIKEALVLLCEVMDVAGDPYGILGFSGMRRSRCDLYRIKDIEEPYNRRIHQRINSILPREYTRMGPALRYSVNQLAQYEARTRLLVTITDGKPEDYDDYKGEYAIEDTRKALMEARGSGIKTFCITVDREAHEYLPQMFGRGNYIFIDEIDKLPVRMIDMYRQLTG